MHSVQHLTRSRRRDIIHTSTVAVAVYPLGGAAQAVVPNQKDLRFDYYRGSGKGGQHRNKTDSAVRCVHIPTGITASVESGRSQPQNKQRALEVVLARVEAKQREQEKHSLQGKRDPLRQATRVATRRVYDEVRDIVRDSERGKLRGVRAVLDGQLEALLGR